MSPACAALMLGVGIDPGGSKISLHLACRRWISGHLVGHTLGLRARCRSVCGQGDIGRRGLRSARSIGPIGSRRSRVAGYEKRRMPGLADDLASASNLEWPLDHRLPPPKASAAGRRLWVARSLMPSTKAAVTTNVNSSDAHQAVLGQDRTSAIAIPFLFPSRQCRNDEEGPGAFSSRVSWSRGDLSSMSNMYVRGVLANLITLAIL